MTKISMNQLHDFDLIKESKMKFEKPIQICVEHVLDNNFRIEIWFKNSICVVVFRNENNEFHVELKESQNVTMEFVYKTDLGYLFGLAQAGIINYNV